MYSPVKTYSTILAIGLLLLFFQCQQREEKKTLSEAPEIPIAEEHPRYKQLKLRIAELTEQFEEEEMEKSDDLEEYRMYFEFGWVPPAVLSVTFRGDFSEMKYKYFDPEDFRKSISPEYRTTIIELNNDDFKKEFEKLNFWKLAEVDTPDFIVLDADRFYIEASIRGKYKLIGRMDILESQVEEFRMFLLMLVLDDAY